MGARESRVIDLPYARVDNNILITEQPNEAVSEWLRKQQQGISSDEDFFEVIESADVEIGEKIGSGYFGAVFAAKFKGVNVAAKLLSVGEDVDISTFKREVCIMRNVTFKYQLPFMCPYIGVTFFEQTKGLYLIMQLANLGSLDHYLRELPENFSCALLARLAVDIAIGMAGLSNVPIVHRDLALRNILISKDPEGKLVPQITDFGLSECACKVRGAPKQSLFPVKWTAPEVLSGEGFTSKADVWSFGITVWELFSKGAVPYSGLGNRETYYFVKKGYRLEKPSTCPEDIYKLLLECWHIDPQKRPTFHQIADKLDVIAQELETKQKEANNNNNNQNNGAEVPVTWKSAAPKKEIPTHDIKNLYEGDNYSGYSFTPDSITYNNKETLAFCSYDDSIKYYQNIQLNTNTIDLSETTAAYDFTPSFGDCYDELPEGSQTCLSARSLKSEQSPMTNSQDDIYPTAKPDWVPDFTSRSCMLCQEPFSAFGFLNKHHCRGCGRLVDGKCSSNFFPIPTLGFPVPVRVCDHCVKTYKGFQKN